MRSTVRVTCWEVVRRPCEPDHVVVTVNRIGGSFSAPAGNDGGSGIAGGASEVREGSTGGRKAAISSAGSLRTVMAAPASTPAVRNGCDWSDELHGSLV